MIHPQPLVRALSTIRESPLFQTDVRVTSMPCGSCQILWEVQLEGRWSKRRGERSRRPDSSGSGWVGPWWRTGPGTNPEILPESTSTNPPLQTEDKQKETKDDVHWLQNNRSNSNHKSFFGHTHKCVSANYLHSRVCIKHLDQASQPHSKQHVWGKHSQGCGHEETL